eukprot:209521-Prymnesium_polylepis.1
MLEFQTDIPTTVTHATVLVVSIVSSTRRRRQACPDQRSPLRARPCAFSSAAARSYGRRRA